MAVPLLDAVADDVPSGVWVTIVVVACVRAAFSLAAFFDEWQDANVSTATMKSKK